MQLLIKNIHINRSTLFYIGLFSLMAILLMIPEHAFATPTTGGDLPYEKGLGKLQKSMTGPVAFTLSILGIVVAGGTLIFGGDLSGFFRTLFFIVLVMSFLVGAQNLMQTFFGQGAEITTLAENTLFSMRRIV
ncbi:MAG: conjugal transfer system pilin TrbC [Gammaproteobacteria bacterium]